MSTPTQTEQERQSFAETALRLGGKSEEEVRRTGALDKADEQVERLFAPQYQTANSPVHRAVWEGRTPLEHFNPPPQAESLPCDAAMQRSIEVVRLRKSSGQLLDERHKVSKETFAELGRAGYWGMLIPAEFGGQGAPFARFARFLTRMGIEDSMISGLASVHGCIGAVDPVRTFGNAEQKRRFLPRLASGEALSGFALTEPNAGSDMTALRTTATPAGDHYEVTGEKLFITNVIPGRTIGLVVLINNKPAVLIVDLPPEENEHFRLKTYGLWALKQAHNNGLVFNRLRVPKENLLAVKQGDGLTVAYHGLNLGRVSLCAGSAGNMRVMLASMLPWAEFRRTYGQPINSRELVKRRIARLAGLIAGADALVDWTGWLIDAGYRGELECIVAKIFGGEAQKEAAIELFMKTHGGRSFLHGHSLGDNIHEYLAPCIYEGEGEILGLAFFKSLVKEHGKAFFEPLGKALQAKGMKTFSPANPAHVWKLKGELARYSKWWLGQKLTSTDAQSLPGMDSRLGRHVQFALKTFQSFPAEISAVLRKHQLKLADRQCRMAELSQRVQDNIVLLVTALWGQRQQNETSLLAADMLCQDLRRKLTGERPTDAYFRDCMTLADQVVAGRYEALGGVPGEEILMKYENR